MSACALPARGVIYVVRNKPVGSKPSVSLTSWLCCEVCGAVHYSTYHCLWKGRIDKQRYFPITGWCRPTGECLWQPLSVAPDPVFSRYLCLVDLVDRFRLDPAGHFVRGYLVSTILERWGTWNNATAKFAWQSRPT